MKNFHKLNLILLILLLIFIYPALSYAQATITLSCSSCLYYLQPGTAYEVSIRITPPDLNNDHTNGGTAYINFDAAFFQITDSSAQPVTTLTANIYFPTVLENEVDNTAGTIKYTVVADPPPDDDPLGVVELVKFYITPLKGTGSTPKIISFDQANTMVLINTDVYPDTNSGRTLTCEDLSVNSAPAPPTGLTITDQGNTHVDLSWDANTDSGVKYNVYRDTKESGNFTTKLTSTPVDTTTYSDTTVDWRNSTTVYFYKVSALDAEDNEGPKSDPSPQAGPDVWPPVIDAQTIEDNPGDVKCDITWKQDEKGKAKDATVKYWKASEEEANALTQNGSSSIASTSIKVTLSGLESTTNYKYRVKSKDRSGNECVYYPAEGEPPLDFTTLAETPVKPYIKNITATVNEDDTVLIEWYTVKSSNDDTENPSDSKVMYGTTSGSYDDEEYDGTYVSYHTMLLTSYLENSPLPDGKYYYKVCSANVAGESCSSEKDFTVGCVGAVISSVVATSYSTSATITWTTDLPATSQVLYGTDKTNLDMSTTETTEYKTSHSVDLSNLNENTTYYYRVKSTVECGTSTISPSESTDPQEFTTSPGGGDYGILTGTVTDSSSGSPISNVTITLDPANAGPGYTNQNGYYEISNVLVGTYNVTATKSGYLSKTQSTVISKDQTTNLNFSLDTVTTTGNLKVTIINESTGAALEGATVTISGPTLTSQTTNSSGVASFTDIPTGTYDVTATKSGYQPSPADPQPKSITVEKDKTAALSINLIQGITITGTCTDSQNGNPIPNLTINGIKDGLVVKTAETNSSGQYTLYLTETGTYTIEVDEYKAKLAGYEKPASQTFENLDYGDSKTANFSLTPLPVHRLDIYTTIQGKEVYEISLAPGGGPVYWKAKGYTVTGAEAQVSNIVWSLNNDEVGTIDADIGVFYAGSKESYGQVLAAVNGESILKENIRGGKITVSSKLSIGKVSLSIGGSQGGPEVTGRPFNPNIDERVRINYEINQLLPKPTVEIRIYDVKGNLVRSFYGGETYGDWDYRDAVGNLVQNGVYFIQVIVTGPQGRSVSKPKAVGIFR